MRKNLAAALTAILLVGLLSVPNFAAGGSYSDVGTGHWAYEFISKWSLGDKPILAGYPDSTFGPNDTIKDLDLDIIISRILGDKEPGWQTSPSLSREQAVKKVAEAFGIPSKTTITDAEKFADHDDISESCAGYVYALKERGIISGVGGNTFAPKDNYTRAQAITVVYKMIGGIVDKNEDVKDSGYSGIVVVRGEGVTLRSFGVRGDVIIGQGVGAGISTLDTVTVSGTIDVRGGGPEGIYVRNSKAASLLVKKEGVTVNVEKGGSVKNTSVSAKDAKVVFETGAETSTVNITGDNVTIAAENGQKIDEIVVDGENATIMLSKKTTVGKITINKKGVTIITDTTVVIGEITFNAAGTLTGNCRISVANIYVNGVSISALIEKLNMADGITAMIGGRLYRNGVPVSSYIAPGGSSSSSRPGGSDYSGGWTAPTATPPPTSPTPTPSATPTPTPTVAPSETYIISTELDGPNQSYWIIVEGPGGSRPSGRLDLGKFGSERIINGRSEFDISLGTWAQIVAELGSPIDGSRFQPE